MWEITAYYKLMIIILLFHHVLYTRNMVQMVIWTRAPYLAREDTFIITVYSSLTIISSSLTHIFCEYMLILVFVCFVFLNEFSHHLDTHNCYN